MFIAPCAPHCYVVRVSNVSVEIEADVSLNTFISISLVLLCSSPVEAIQTEYVFPIFTIIVIELWKSAGRGWPHHAEKNSDTDTSLFK